MSKLSQFQVGVVNEINPAVTAVTFASSATTSSILDCGGTAPTGVILPSSFTAGNISFNVCKTPNGTFLPLTNFDGSAFSIAVTGGNWVPLLPAMFNSVLYLQLQCSNAQSGAVTVDFALAPIFQGIHN